MVLDLLAGYAVFEEPRDEFIATNTVKFSFLEGSSFSCFYFSISPESFYGLVTFSVFYAHDVASCLSAFAVDLFAVVGKFHGSTLCLR